MKSKLSLTAINRSGGRLPRKYLESWLSLLWRELKSRKRINKKYLNKNEITVVFLALKEARQLNFEFRGKNYATDVLSFSNGAGPGGGDSDSLGELVICPEVLKRQAKEHKLTFRQELAYMVLHGVLHLIGFDHEGSAQQARRMFRLQDDIYFKCQRSAE